MTKVRRLKITFLALMAFGIYAFGVVPLVQSLATPNQITLTPSEYAAMNDVTETPTGEDGSTEKYYTVKWLGVIPIKKVMVNVLPFDTILIGGTPLGICGQIDGVLVTQATADGSLQTGDIIYAVNGAQVQNLAQYNHATAGQGAATLTIRRAGQNLSKMVDLCQNLALRDQTTGVGMLTFINPENNTFSALGHQMTDFETGAAVDLCGGCVLPVTTHGIIKTAGAQTGTLESSIQTRATPEGSITRGNQFGITGCFQPGSPILSQTTTTMPVATRYHVKPGAATLRTCLDGDTVQEFACEILKTRYQDRQRDKSMVIRVTDPRLIEQTGGIIHGMSGSPIIQNGHLVGALTHAMTRDPAKGYAVYIDFVTI